MPVPVRILHVCEFPTVSGGERSLLTWLRHAPPAYAPVVVAPPAGPLAEQLAELGVPLWSPPEPAGRAAFLRRHRVQLLHANSLSMGVAWTPAARSAGVPGVVHVRDIQRLGERRRAALAGAHRLVAVSRAVAESLLSQGLEPDRIRVIPNGLGPEAPDRALAALELRRLLRLSPQTRLAGSAGQLSLRKGQDLFLAAARLLAPRFPDLHFVLFGARLSRKEETRRFEARLHAEARRPPLAGRVHFPGWHPDFPRLVAGLDLLLHPARQEPLSRVLLEALRAGTPVVGTAVGGTPEILGEGAGLLVPPENPAALARAAAALLNSGSLRAACVQAGRRRLRTFFSARRMVAALDGLFREVLQER